MENTTKVQIIEELAQYHERGGKAIEAAYDIYSSNGGEMTEQEFRERLDIREIDNIEFMYDSDTEEHATEEQMIEYYDSVLA